MDTNLVSCFSDSRCSFTSRLCVETQYVRL